MSTTEFSCPQCGAKLASDETCRDRFNISQLKEVEQPSYYPVHHLSVICYMLQHNVYSRKGWIAARDLLFQFVYRGLTPTMVRRRNRVKSDRGHRTWSITKGARLPGVENIAWTCTIADVRLDTPEMYCANVRHWAESILADSEQPVQLINEEEDEHDGTR